MQIMSEETHDVTPDSSTEQSVPYDRFQEVNEERNTLRNEVEFLKGELTNLKESKEVEEEPSDWKEAKDRAVQEALTAFEQKQQEKDARDKENEDKIEKDFSHLSALGGDITKEVKTEVLEKMIKDGSTDVFATYLKIQGEKKKIAQTQQQKEEGYVPPQTSGSDIPSPSFSYESIQGKSAMDIESEAGEA
jgi:hypothetical protein